MKAAIFGKNYNEEFTNSLIDFFTIIHKFGFEILIYEPYYKFIKSFSNYDPQPSDIFNDALNKEDGVDILFSIGGDGTFLESVTFVRDLEIPIAGINSGRLGFLANISQEDIPVALNAIIKGNYKIEDRTLLEINSYKQVFENFNYALNEITVQKRDSGSMITIKVFVNGEFVNTYWADGLILSTPTGSTAYSLSLGGPIVVPGSRNFILTPIAPHNLTVRPIVVPDNTEISIEVAGRTENYLLSADYRSEIVEKNTKLLIKAANFSVKTIRIENTNFYDTIREKLSWGLDKRN
jgi:NAD+ kinase